MIFQCCQGTPYHLWVARETSYALIGLWRRISSVGVLHCPLKATLRDPCLVFYQGLTPVDLVPTDGTFKGPFVDLAKLIHCKDPRGSKALTGVLKPRGSLDTLNRLKYNGPFRGNY